MTEDIRNVLGWILGPKAGYPFIFRDFLFFPGKHLTNILKYATTISIQLRNFIMFSFDVITCRSLIHHHHSRYRPFTACSGSEFQLLNL
jgi:hypothetical protein